MTDEINGVKIERLPTVGKPLSLKGTRYRPSMHDLKVDKAKEQKLKKLKKVLSEAEKEERVR